MPNRQTTCCFTGHRPAKLPWGANESDPRCEALKAELYARITGAYDSGYRHFISGMALGCDTYFAEAVLQLKQERPDVTLEAAVPCRTQPSRWNKRQKLEYSDLLEHCDTVTILQEEYTPNCMMRRNKYMVDHSSLLIACFNGTAGGTMNTIVYAGRQEDMTTILIDLEAKNEASAD